MNKTYTWIGIILLVFSLGCNLWLYRLEPTAEIDPNDNAFQYALIDRTNTIWDYANRTCPHNILCHIALLSDHWVPNWAEGYNLPYYYSHVPQILIVGTYRLFHLPISLFQYYHIIIYLFLCLFPLSLFLAFRIVKFPWLTAGIAALVASQISTDGLYGIDPSSFLWRGWGLSSQLFALFWFPLAIAWAIRYVSTSTCSMYPVAWSILFLVLTTMGHLGIGMMAFMGIGVICLSPAVANLLTRDTEKHIWQSVWMGVKQTLYIAVPAIIILGYWIVPAFVNNNFHNISIWDPVWKFNSFGVVEVITKLVNGDLFDFGRFPLFTILVLIGLFVALSKPRETQAKWGFLFLFFLVLFFGKTTFGNLLNLIPGMSEFHGHRFIVGLHLAGLFLAPLGLAWIIEKISNFKLPRLFVSLCICILTCAFLVPQTIRYALYNDTLIQKGNAEYELQKSDATLLLETIRNLQKDRPGRVYALRGNEGKDFRIASTPYYMHLSTYGIPTVLWLPETWSPNSDTEQFFSEDTASHYQLYNIRYVVTPATRPTAGGPQPFWKLIQETTSWKLYEVETDGYLSVGTAPAIVSAKKTSLVNLVHLWIQSPYPKQQIYPEIRLTHTDIQNELLPHFSMTDEITYKTPDGKTHSLFAQPPVYLSPIPTALPINILSQLDDTDMVFRATVEVTKECLTCVVVLKETYHPSWRVTVNGKSMQPISVFPFYTAIRLETPGTYDIVFSYTPKFSF